MWGFFTKKGENTTQQKIKHKNPCRSRGLNPEPRVNNSDLKDTGIASLTHISHWKESFISYIKLNVRICFNTKRIVAVFNIILSHVYNMYYKKCYLPPGGGTQYRRRQCDSPLPEGAGVTCRGDSTVERSCASKPCTVWTVFKNKTIHLFHALLMSMELFYN